ncbi:hypothetical protein [Brevibacillus laterosporus]|uniref:hypothetical protein n=1 Tax=Brevibacillus laterosporus TaxID=1465 RepID=UPI002E1EFAF0|nr:hypothetical protein [Brevibacillus laterosporus]MED1670303.1 hypothetical protein [Brevibacillus laterosporus]MED1717902.1 hypothetical protein [Brevibacillus laterosporus]
MRKTTLLIVLVIIFTPILLGLLLNIPTGWMTIGDESSWVGFFGNYSGGIIGGIVAFLVAKSQVNDQIEKQIKNEEENKFINQMPALVSIKFELEKMKKSITGAYHLRDEIIKLVKDPEEGLYKSIQTRYKLYQLSDENWKNIALINDVNFHISLIELKNFYKEIQVALHINIDILEEKLEKELIIVNSVLNVDFDTDITSMKLELEEAKETKRWAWEELKSRDFIRIIDDHLDVINIVIIAIEEVQEERANIRDRV